MLCLSSWAGKTLVECVSKGDDAVLRSGIGKRERLRLACHRDQTEATDGRRSSPDFDHPWQGAVATRSKHEGYDRAVGKRRRAFHARRGEGHGDSSVGVDGDQTTLSPERSNLSQGRTRGFI
jgi:hypothetical protein